MATKRLNNHSLTCPGIPKHRHKGTPQEAISCDVCGYVRHLAPCTVCDGTVHRLLNNPPPGETVADFRQRIALMMRNMEAAATGKRYSMVGGPRAHSSVVRQPGSAGTNPPNKTTPRGAQARQSGKGKAVK